MYRGPGTNYRIFDTDAIDSERGVQPCGPDDTLWPSGRSKQRPYLIVARRLAQVPTTQSSIDLP